MTQSTMKQISHINGDSMKNNLVAYVTRTRKNYQIRIAPLDDEIHGIAFCICDKICAYELYGCHLIRMNCYVNNGYTSQFLVSAIVDETIDEGYEVVKPIDVYSI